MIKATRFEYSMLIAFLSYMLVLVVGLALLYFTTAIVVALVVGGIVQQLAYKWLVYVWPPKTKCMEE